MQCKDIPDAPILRFVQKHGGIGCNWFDAVYAGGSVNERSVRHAMPDGLPDKLVLAKMRQMMARGVVNGCPCGCRGDYEITEKGLREIDPLK